MLHKAFGVTDLCSLKSYLLDVVVTYMIYAPSIREAKYVTGKLWNIGSSIVTLVSIPSLHMSMIILRVKEPPICSICNI